MDLLKCSRILSSRTVSGKFPTQRCRVSRTIVVPQVLHGDDLSCFARDDRVCCRVCRRRRRHSLPSTRAALSLRFCSDRHPPSQPSKHTSPHTRALTSPRTSPSGLEGWGGHFQRRTKLRKGQFCTRAISPGKTPPTDDVSNRPRSRPFYRLLGGGHTRRRVSAISGNISGTFYLISSWQDRHKVATCTDK